MGITGSTALWYASRATGVAALLLLTAVVVLGVMVNRRGRLPGLPRFATTGLHRNLPLLAVALMTTRPASIAVSLSSSSSRLSSVLRRG